MSFTWKIVALVGLLGVVALAVHPIVAEFRAVKEAGGFAAYVENLNSTNYKLIRSTRLSEIVIVAFTGAAILRMLFPGVIGEAQMDFIYAILVAVLSREGISVGQFFAKRWTADPAVIQANAAAAATVSQVPPPNVEVTGKSGTVTVEQSGDGNATIPAQPLVSAEKFAPPAVQPVPARQRRMVADD